jgi:hypothetical protein
MLIGIRFMTFGNIGGYGYAASQPSHSPAFLKSVYSLLVNVLPLSVFGINSTVQSTGATLITALYSCLVPVLAISYRGPRSSTKGILAAFALLSAVPAITVIGWIQPSLQHTRNLYWPSVWIALLLALALQWMSTRAILTGAFVVLQVAGLSYNIWVYRDLLNRADVSVNRVKRAVGLSRAPRAEVQIVGVPDDPNGVFYFRSELEERLARALPDVRVRFCSTLDLCASAPGASASRFQWDTRFRMLTPMP